MLSNDSIAGGKSVYGNFENDWKIRARSFLAVFNLIETWFIYEIFYDWSEKCRWTLKDGNQFQRSIGWKPVHGKENHRAKIINWW